MALATPPEIQLLAKGLHFIHPYNAITDDQAMDIAKKAIEHCEKYRGRREGDYRINCAMFAQIYKEKLVAAWR